MRWDIDDIPVFAAVVEHHGITAAADALGMAKSTVSATISRLERALGLRLFERNSRNIRLTEEGAAFHRHAQLILEQVAEADATIAGLRADPAGRLTVALPPAFCHEVVAPRLARFHSDYPKIDLELIVTTRGLDLLREQVDVAVVVGPLADSDLIARPLIYGALIWVASPAYLENARLGHGLDDLRSHIQICETRYALTRMPLRVDGHAAHIDLGGGITRIDNPLVVRNAVLHGAGIAPVPRHYCRDQIADGSLVEVFTHVTVDARASSLSVVYPGRRLISPRLRVFLDFLTEASR